MLTALTGQTADQLTAGRHHQRTMARLDQSRTQLQGATLDTSRSERWQQLQHSQFLFNHCCTIQWAQRTASFSGSSGPGAIIFH